MFKIFKEALRIGANNKERDAEAHDIKYGECYDTNKDWYS